MEFDAMMTDDTPLADVEFVAFDLETTGLLAAADRIVEIGALRFRLNGSELSSFEQIVDPECDISVEVTQVHGITNRMVRGKPFDVGVFTSQCAADIA